MSQGFHLVPAHSVETLAAAFSAQIERRENPLVAETVLVMNYAQGVWLRRFVAKKLGVCANIRFLSPEKFLENLVAKENSVFSRGALTWRIFETLRKIHAPGAKTPKDFLFETNSGTNSGSDSDFFRLALHLGDLFWRYQSFRPQMIRDWTNDVPAPKNADKNFLREYRRQKNLWRAVVPAGKTPDAIAWLNLLESENPPEKIPARIFAFAPSALPRIHFELLKKLSESIEVFLYFHNLSTDFWTESAEEKKRLRERLRKSSDNAAKNSGNDDLSDETPDGCELLAAWGKAARPLTMQLIDDGFLDAEANRDKAPKADSLLHTLQRNIRQNAPSPQPFDPRKDNSLKISIAPNPLREMEILRNELIDRFVKDPDLAPGEILIMLPDIKTYSPFIYAVFENSGIPFSIADRTETDTESTASKFLEILRVARGELRIDEIFALLDSAVVQRALALDDSAVAALEETLKEAGVRWGADSAFRRERIFGEKILPPKAALFAENNSWEFGLRRLALGYMLGNDDEENAEKFGGKLEVLPVGNLTEGAPEAIGKIARLVKILAEINRAFLSEEKRDVPAWCAFLQSVLLDDFLDADNAGAEIVRNVLATAERDAEQGSLSAGTPQACSLEAFAVALEKSDWNGTRAGSGMLRGKITFCEMRPMRNIPAKIIGIAGLSDGKFPRSDPQDCLDLTKFPAKNFPAGTAFWDRSSRDDDCLLFLEAILAAKETLLLSYVGRTAGDGQSVPPCVPLGKLRDYLLKMSTQEDAETPGEPTFETLHRLHGFSEEYFSTNDKQSPNDEQSRNDKHPQKFFSFSREDYAVASCDAGKHQACFAEKPHPLNEREREKLAEISMRELTDFFQSPAKFICKHRFDIGQLQKRGATDANDPATLFSWSDETQVHRNFVEKILNDAGEGVPADEELLTKSIADFHRRAILSGTTAPLAREGEFDDALKEKIKDGKALREKIQPPLFRVKPDDIPRTLEFETDETSIPVVRVALRFDSLFRTPTGELFLVLYGKKNFDWRSACEIFVAAQMLAEAFPQNDFTAAYFAYADKTSPKIITRRSLAAAKMSPQDLIRFYAAGTISPPMIFEKTPFEIAGKTADDFWRETEQSWTKTEQARGKTEQSRRGNAASAEEIFVFGENAPETFRENIKQIAFPFVCAVRAAFDDKKKEKKPRRTRKN